MRLACLLSVVLLATGLVGCRPAREAIVAPGSESATSSSASPPSSVAEVDARATFLAAFRRASERKDLEQMLALYCWDGVDAEMRDTVRGNVQDELRQPTTGLQIEPVELGKFGPSEEGGIRWRPNLPVVAVLKVKFAPAPPGSGMSVSEAEYTLGLQRGEYRMTVPVRD